MRPGALGVEWDAETNVASAAPALPANKTTCLGIWEM